MKRFAVALWFLVANFSPAFAGTLWFSAMQRQPQPPFNGVEAGVICIAWEDGRAIFANPRLEVTVYGNSKRLETFSARSGDVQPRSRRCGGKEHDCWEIPPSFKLTGAGSKFSVWMDLSPSWNSASVNNCVRCGGAHLRNLATNHELELRRR